MKGGAKENLPTSGAIDVQIPLLVLHTLCSLVVVSIILKKKEHERIRRWPSHDQSFEAPAIYIGHQIFQSASTHSKVVHVVQEGYLYTMHRIVSGFDPDEIYYYVSGNEPPDAENEYGKNHIFGYLIKVD